MKGAHRVSSLVLALVAFVITTKGVYGAQHAVGGSQGWEESVDLNSWASGQTFKVGDQLVFKYTSGLHSVVEISNEAAYKNCDLGTPINSMSTGNDVVKLEKPGTRYFICGTLGHCDQGMKVKIVTVSGNAPSSPGSSSPPSTSSSPNSSFATYALQHFMGFVLFGSLLSMVFML